jgi:hypothetical protein
MSSFLDVSCQICTHLKPTAIFWKGRSIAIDVAANCALVIRVWLRSEVGPIWPLYKFDGRHQQSHTRTTTIQFVATPHKGAELPRVGTSLPGAVTSHDGIICRRGTKDFTSLPTAVTSQDALVCCSGPKVLTSLPVVSRRRKPCLPLVLASLSMALEVTQNLGNIWASLLCCKTL